MALFSGKIVRGKEVVVDRIAGRYGRYSSAGSGGWRGSFSVPASKTVPPGEYTLVLTDGQSARILVTHVFGNRSGGSVAFEGRELSPPE